MVKKGDRHHHPHPFGVNILLSSTQHLGTSRYHRAAHLYAPRSAHRQLYWAARLCVLTEKHGKLCFKQHSLEYYYTHVSVDNLLLTQQYSLCNGTTHVHTFHTFEDTIYHKRRNMGSMKMPRRFIRKRWFGSHNFSSFDSLFLRVEVGKPRRCRRAAHLWSPKKVQVLPQGTASLRCHFRFLERPSLVTIDDSACCAVDIQNIKICTYSLV